jgi:copper chaperone
MLTFHIPNMTCGGCAKAITRAIQQIDLGASVEAEPSRREIKDGSSADEKVLLNALQQAGYPAMPVLAALG